MAFVIRIAIPADAEQLIAHVHRLAEEPDVDVPLAPGEIWHTVEEERKILEEHAALENSISLVAEAEGEIIGWLNCQGGSRKATRHAVILGIAVRRDWRNQGVGSALITHAIAWARDTSIVTRIELAVYARNARAIHLYESFGFEVEGRRRRALYQKGAYLDDLIMALIL
jgi:ribosomal protein S18 acetylase RimI-like enzyme